MHNIETNLKNRLALLSIIQKSDWFKDLLIQPEKTEVELTEEGKDPNPAPPPNQPLAPEEPLSLRINMVPPPPPIVSLISTFAPAVKLLSLPIHKFPFP